MKETEDHTVKGGMLNFISPVTNWHHKENDGIPFIASDGKCDRFSLPSITSKMFWETSAYSPKTTMPTLLNVTNKLFTTYLQLFGV
jgi:hypothetical protein